MFFNSQTKVSSLTINDLPTGGEIGTAEETVELFTYYYIEQTTDAQTLALPIPLYPDATRLITIENIGSVPFAILDEKLYPTNICMFRWDGSEWSSFSTQSKYYLHNQTIASSTWTINHNLGRYPSVTIIDLSNREMSGDVVFNNQNTITITFKNNNLPYNIAGKAVLN